jgi:DNA-directed RNA polymerase subunit H (RpoH/RPB5)
MDAVIIPRVVNNTVMSVVREMLSDRGYTSSVTDDCQIHGCNDNGDNIVVFFVKGKLNIDTIREHVELLKENEIKNGIIICTDEITPKGKSIVETINNIGEIHLEVFNIDDFIFNKTKHRLVPKHIKINAVEAADILKKYGKIPEILVTDPIVKYYGCVKGNVVKVIRQDGGICYRLVV